MAVKNWAIVVGINVYPQQANQNPLSGAVGDALDFADWALHPDGGNVDPANLFLWTYPPAGPGIGSARVQTYNRAPTAWTNGFDQIPPRTDRPPLVEEIFQTAWAAARGAAGELRASSIKGRCFVFLAGHGVQGRAKFDTVPQTCFLAGDFQENGPVNGLVPTEDLRVGLLTCGFAQVFMFLDCCRLNLMRLNEVVRNLNSRQTPILTPRYGEQGSRQRETALPGKLQPVIRTEALSRKFSLRVCAEFGTLGRER